jgi:alpha-glucosidase
MTHPRHARSLVPLLAASLCSTLTVFSQPGSYTLQSPDKKTEVRIETGKTLSIAISRDGRTLVSASPISLEIEGRPPLGPSSSVESGRTDTVSETIVPAVAEKRKIIPDIYRQLTLRFAGGWSLIVRAYDDGIAYRYRTEFPGEVVVMNEAVTVRLSVGDSVWFPAETSFLSHSERLYTLLAANAIADTQMCVLPAVVVTAAGPKVALTEADLLDYPGLYLKGAGQGEPTLHSVFPAYPEEEQQVDVRTVKVTKRAPYLARTRGTREFPWRVFAIAEKDGDLIENDIVYRLGSPTVLKETAWIRPGKVAWDWWNANNLFGVSFKSGVNTATYKHFIDFAAANKIEYVIFDEGWSKTSDLFQINPAMDMDALFAYAKRKNVGIILWVNWNALQGRMTEAFDRFASWGAKGIKVDFMQRDDQKMVNFYEEVSREAAKRRLLVDFHGAYKPTGLSRTYPNVLTREGVRGLEHSKWSADVTPGHDVTLPFTRMFAGAMDFTPGAMLNASKENFRPIFEEPMSQGTRCHQLAMYVVYESPLQMLCDNPSRYKHEPEMMEFLSAVPTTWDETKVLNGSIGKHVTVARRKGKTWYIGAMTDWTPREFALDLGFIGKCEILAYEDGINADRHAGDFTRRKSVLKAGELLTVRLAPGGGWAAIIKPAATK